MRVILVGIAILRLNTFMAWQKVAVRVPATTANLGPGFDSLGVALRLHNTVILRPGVQTQLPPMFSTTAKTFFGACKARPFPFSVEIQGNVPISRGLGSSVTVRLGILAGLNQLANCPLSPEQVLSLVVEMEGHPDNAVPAFYGGFAACASGKFLNVPVSPKLKFITLIPDLMLQTSAARKVLPKKVSLADAVCNLQHSSVITAAFCARQYSALSGLFNDRLHQPYRAKLIPGFEAILDSAEKAGALGSFLSGSGSTLMAITLQNPEKVRNAMLRTASKHLPGCTARILTADNNGLQIKAS